MDDVAAAREEYSRGGLTENDLTPEPYALFRRWYDEAGVLPEPNAMVVATVSPQGLPSARFVLLKGVRTDPESADGFCFYTNLGSQKGRDLAAHPAISVLFPWHPLERQIRVTGRADLLPRADVEAYFASRPRGSRLGAWASHQSRPVAGRDELDAEYAAAERRFDGGDVPAPDFWGGYLVRPESIEFWQGRPGRMHDRLVYTRTADGGWTTQRLAP